MSVVHERLHRSETPDGQWWLKSTDGTVYGPAEIAVLCEWAAQNRIAPGYLISPDNKNWEPAESLPDLKLVWFADLPDGRTYGPFHVLAVPQLYDAGILTSDSKLTNRATGNVMMVHQLLKASKKDARKSEDLAQHKEKTWEDRYRKEKKARLLHEAQLQGTIDMLSEETETKTRQLEKIEVGALSDVDVQEKDQGQSLSKEERLAKGIAKLEKERKHYENAHAGAVSDLESERKKGDKLRERAASVEAKSQEEKEELKKRLATARAEAKEARKLLQENEKVAHKEQKSQGQRKKELTDKLEQARADADGRTQEIQSELERVQKELEGQKTLYAKISQDGTKQEETLLHEADSARTAMVNAQHELDKLKERFGEREGEYEETHKAAKKQFEDLLKEKEAVDETILGLNSELADRDAASREMAEKAEEKDSEFNSLRSSLSELEDRCSALEREKTELDQKAGELNGLLDDERKQLDNARAAAEESATQLSRNLGEIEKEKGDLEGLLKISKNEFTAHKREAAKTEKGLSRDLERFQKKAEKEAESIGEMKQQLKDLREENSALNSRMSKDEKKQVTQIRELEQEKNTLVQNADQVREDYSSVSHELESVKKDMESLQEKYEKVQADFDSDLQAQKTLNADLSNGQGEREKELLTQIESLGVSSREAGEEWQGERDGLESRISELQSALQGEKSAQEDISRTKGEGKKKLLAQVESLEASSREAGEKWQGERDGLESRISELQSALQGEKSAQDDISRTKGEREKELLTQVESLEASSREAAEKWDSEKDQLEARVSDLQSELQEEQAAEGELEGKLLEQVARLEAEKDLLGTVGTERDKLRKQAESLEQDLKKRDDQLATQVRSFEAASEKVHGQWDAERDAFRKNADEAGEDLEKLKSEARTREAELEGKLESNESASANSREQWEGEKERFEARISDLETRLEGEQSVHADLSKGKSDLETKLLQQVEELEAERDTLNAVIEERDSLRREVSKSIEEAESLKDSASRKEEQLQEQIQEIEKRARETAEKWTSESEQLESRIADVDRSAGEEKHVLESRLAERESEFGAQTDILTDAKMVLQETRDNLSASRSRLKELEKELGKKGKEAAKQEKLFKKALEESEREHVSELEDLKSQFAKRETKAGREREQVDTKAGVLEEELTKALLERDRLSEELADINKRLEERTAFAEEREFKLQGSLDQARDELRQSSAEYQEMIERQRSEADQRDNDAASVRAELEQQGASLRNELEITVSQRDEAASGLETATTRASELENTMEEKEEAFRHELASSADERERLANARVEEVESSAKEQIEAVQQSAGEQMQEADRSARARIEEIEARRAEHEAREAEAITERDALSARIQELEQTLDAMTADREVVKQALAGTRENVGELESELKRVREQSVQEVEQVNHTATENESVLRSLINGEKSRYEALKSESSEQSDALNGRIRDLEDLLATTQGERDQTTRDLEESRERVVSQAEGISERESVWEKEEGSLRKELDGTLRELSLLNEKHDKLSEESSDTEAQLRSDVKQLKADFKGMLQSSKSLEKQLAHEKKERSAVEDESKANYDQLIDTRHELQILREQYEPLIKQAQKHEQALTKQLARLESERAHLLANEEHAREEEKERRKTEKEEEQTVRHLAPSGSLAARMDSMPLLMRGVGAVAAVLVIGSITYTAGRRTGSRLERSKSVDILREADERELEALKSVSEITEAEPFAYIEDPLSDDTGSGGEEGIVSEVVTDDGDLKPLPLVTLDRARVTYRKKNCAVVFDSGIFSNLDLYADGAERSLYDVARQLKGHTDDFRLIIEGHTDAVPVSNRATSLDNYQLGMKRAQKVLRTMRDKYGLPESFLSAVSAGEVDPPYPNDDAEHRRKNRTVILKIVRRRR